MQNELVIPNYHVVLIHFPLALLTTGALIELFSFLWRRSAFRAAGRWMILLGALTAVPTVTTGIFALHDVATRGLAPAQKSQPWKAVSQQSTLSDHQWEMLTDHAKLQISATGLALFLVFLWIACSDTWRTRLHIPLLLVLLASVAVAVVGAWYGGELVYAHGTAVMVENSRSEHEHAAATETASTTAASTTSTAANEKGDESHIPPNADITFFVPPLQLHLILAGITIAIALAALGLSIRKITQGIPFTQVDHIAAALGDQAPDTITTDPPDVGQPRLAVSRFWLLALLSALLTAGAGYWMLGLHEHSWMVADLWNGTIAYNMRNGNYRQLAHIIAGGSIAVLALILALLARWGPRQKFLLGLFAIILIAIVGLQIWFGVLLLFDTRQGPVFRFN